MFNSAVEVVVHCKRFSVPITRHSKPLKLFANSVAVFFIPIPAKFDKLFSANFFFCFSFICDCLNNFCFGCNCRVVSSRKPKCVKTFHSLISDENVLNCVIECVSNVKLPSDIWWWHNNRKMRFF